MKVLFQGDSITDSNRNREFDPHLGHGYATMVAAELGYNKPGEYEFLNRGIGGNRIDDLYCRMKKDIINLKPDLISILLGVNDVLYEYDHKTGVEADRFERLYNILIEDIKKFLPDVKIMILEPFLLPGRLCENNYDEFLAEVKLRASAAKRVAEKNELIFVPLQKKFDEFSNRYSPDKISIDGIHPNPAGHKLIAAEWLKGFEKLF